MRDRTPKYPGRIRLVPEDGSAPFYAKIERADEPTQAGDPLNKNTFLTDATSALFGMSAAAVPDNVFSFLGQYNLHWWKKTDASGTETYVQSTNRNEYPDFGEVSGYKYAYMGVPFQNSVDAKNTAVGFYSGTGKYGASKKNSLTFNFVPKFVVVIKDERNLINVSSTHSSNIMTWVDGVSSDRTMTSGEHRYYSRSNNTLSWYDEGSADNQLNANGTKYFWFAVG